MKNWQGKISDFEIIDVRKAGGNFLPGLLTKARKLEVGQGVCIVQSFEPLPLYSAMAELGFDHYTEKVSESEFRVYFYREAVGESSYKKTGDLPMKPMAIVNYKNIDDRLANTAVSFWDLIWNSQNPAIDAKTKLLLSLSNAVGAGRLRQATRELVKTYSLGLTVPEMNELFSLFAWNGGIGTFSSEIGPSQLFKAYQTIKNMEKQGKGREDIMKKLMQEFGETNPEVGVIS